MSTRGNAKIEHGPYEQEFWDTEEENHICKHFQCSKTLTHEERLYGDFCISHQSKPSLTQLIDRTLKGR